jgi:shikimate dehydrogenase
MKNAFVIGHPISHSKSPKLHGFWLEKLNIDGSYQAIDVAPENLVDFARSLELKDLVGGNATLPHKEHLLQICDELTATAKAIGAVNTIWLQNGKLYGDNTDKYGFLANLDQQSLGWDAKTSRAIMIGAGGAARAILMGLIERGYKEIFILNRTIDRAAQLASEFEQHLNDQQLRAAKLSDFNRLAGATDFVVNTSSVGMKGTKFDDLDVEQLSKNAIVTDIVYTPLVTPLLADAQKAGLGTIDGLGMLLHQAVPGFEKWFGVRPEVTDELRAHILEA